MDRRQLLIAGFGACLMPGAAWGQDFAALARPLHGQHPGAYYVEAGRLLQSGQRDAAVFIFYLGQLRFRTHLAARPNLRRDGDPAAFAAVSESIDRPVNEYAFGDMPVLVRTLDAVLAYDRANPDPFTDPTTFPEPVRRTREGMAQYRANLAGRFDEIRRLRAANGLENR